MKTVAIVQSNYIPWRGYFDLIAAVDEFIVYDEVQYTRADWRNRNRFKTPRGAQWLTVPVKSKGLRHQPIRAAEIADHGWATTHWRSLEANYRRAAHFEAVAEVLRPIYLGPRHERLSPLNRTLIDACCRYIGIDTRITDASDYVLAGDRTERLRGLCEQAGATAYVSGPAARAYLDESRFAERGIAVRWFGYEGLADYPQLWGDFDPRVSVLDLMFNCGPLSSHFLGSTRP